MKKLLAASALIVLVAAGSGFALYVAGEPQRRKPADQTQQPKESRPAPPDAPKTGQAVPRPQTRNEPPDRPRRGPEGPRGPGRIVIPYPGWPWWGYPYPYDYPPATPWRVYADWQTASVRIDVEPTDASVYVDRYYAGAVDDFDGIFQHLTLRPGPHLIEIRKAGYATLAVELNLYPGQSVTYRRTMEPSSTDSGVPAVAPLAPGFEEGAALPAPADITVPPGDVRFDVTPKDAQIYADGFYAGIVDDFNGSQRLQLAPGRHHVAIRMEGYESIEVDLSIESARSITYRTALKKLN